MSSTWNHSYFTDKETGSRKLDRMDSWLRIHNWLKDETEGEKKEPQKLQCKSLFKCYYSLLDQNHSIKNFQTPTGEFIIHKA